MFKESPHIHFERRAPRYNASASWVQDSELLDLMYEKSKANSEMNVLDLATGTGQVAKRFYQNVKKLTGIDISKEMTSLNKYTDELVIGSAYDMPFDDKAFDLVVCRQGLQFMDLSKVLPQVSRVLAPEGCVILAHLTCYDENDRDETFKIQKLRNPSRYNYFEKADIPQELEKHGFKLIECLNYGTREPVINWINNGAISQESIDEIINLYRNASEKFTESHEVSFEGSEIFDTMNMQVIYAKKRL